MLFDKYNKNDDPFYKKQLKIYSETEIEFIEKTCLDIPVSQLTQMEVILRRILLSPYFSLNEMISAKDFLCILLLHVPYVTKSYLVCLGIFQTETAIRKFISRNTCSEKNKKGILRSYNLTGNTVRKAYALTAAGRNYAKSLLPEEYVEKYINTPGSTSGNSHDVSLLSLFYRLVGDSSFHYFRWHTSPLIKEGASIHDALANSGILEKEERGLKPDALIENVEFNDYVFVEQDMGTESKGILTEKFNRYADFFKTMKMNEQFNYQIVFTVSTDRSRSSFINSPVTPNAAQEHSASKLKRIKKEMFNFIAALDEDEPDISGLKNILSDKLKDDNLKKKYPASYNTFLQLRSVLETITDEKPSAASIDDIREYFDNLIGGQNELVSAMAEWNSENLKNRRKETIREAVMSSELKQCLLNGVNVICLNCSNLTDLHGIFIEEYMKSHLNRYAIPAINKKVFRDNSLCYEYDPATALMAGKDRYFILRHSFVMKGHSNIHLIFENISDNIAGECRVRNLLSHPDINESYVVYLFLLVNSIQEAIDFNSSFDVPLNKTFGNQEGNIHVSYIDYTEKKLSKPFYFNKSGSITYY